ncbi:speckle-type POZ protein [Caerostris darwini]|uniref:Speckle-type POZ protein n=1 Tax=Caerostris darwini TaxID=1538125 RepID=A0AAV4W490_9ARAC|nr:speckle-type POZ protein [Caerostris darwini]
MAEQYDDVVRKGYTLLWYIQNFNVDADILLQRDKVITFFNPFGVHLLEKNSNWLLSITVYKNKDFLEFDLGRNESDDTPVDIELSLLSPEGSSLLTKQITSSSQSVFEFKEFAEKDDVFVKRKQEFLNNDTLTLRCRIWPAGKETDRSDLCVAQSELFQESECFFLTVENFSSLKAGEKRSFDIDSKFDILPPMEISLSLSDEGDDVRIEFFAESEEIELRTEEEKVTIVTYWKLSVIDTIGGVVDEKNWCMPIILESNATNEINDIIPLTEKSKLKAKKDIYLSEDTLILKCFLSIPNITKIVYDSHISEVLTEDVQQLTSQDTQDVQQSPTRTTKGVRRSRTGSSRKEKNSPSEEMTSLYEHLFLVDTNLVVEDTCIAVHKVVLRSRSSVFKDMLQNMSEDSCSNITLPDLDIVTARKLIKFMYTDIVEDLTPDNATHLYLVADKYKLLDLKNHCSEFLKNNFTLHNVCDVLIFSDKHGDDDLKISAQDYILSKGKEIIRLDVWQIFRESHQNLALEVMESMYLEDSEKNGLN